MTTEAMTFYDIALVLMFAAEAAVIAAVSFWPIKDNEENR